MKNRPLVILIVLVIVGLFAVVISQKPTHPQTVAHQTTKQTKTEVAFCPTMQAVVNKLDLLEEFEFKLVGSSQEALQLLKLNKIDAVIIGRKARADEIESNTKEFQIDLTATTLVADRYQAIKSRDLTLEVIATSLPLETASEKCPDLNFVSANEEEEANEVEFNGAKMANKTSHLELVLWKDFDYSKQDLAVVIDETGDKVASFRTPFVYYDADDLDRINNLIADLKRVYE